MRDPIQQEEERGLGSEGGRRKGGGEGKGKGEVGAEGEEGRTRGLRDSDARVWGEGDAEEEVDGVQEAEDGGGGTSCCVVNGSIFWVVIIKCDLCWRQREREEERLHII